MTSLGDPGPASVAQWSLAGAAAVDQNDCRERSQEIESAHVLLK